MKEYGRKPYLSDNYYDMMHKKTNAEVWADTVEKHSEFEKPYLTKPGEYAQMQHYRPTIPGFGFNLEDFEFPFDPYDAYVPWHLTFHCTATSEDCYCEGDENCFNLNCTYEIIGVDILDTGWGVTASGSRVCLTAPDDESGSVEINVNMRAPRPWKSPHGTSEFVYGTHYSISISACDEKDCCSGTVTAYDYVNSSPTIVREADATVYVTGTGTEITWGITGTGFSIVGNGLSATVSADDTACGSGTITATSDCDGSTATGYIRCTTGTWNAQAWSCPIPGAWTTHTPGSKTLERVEGQYKVIQTLEACQGTGPCELEGSCVGLGTCTDFTECIEWTCVDIFTTGVNCFTWCCGFPGCEDTPGANGFCVHNKSKTLSKWECS